MRLSNFELQAIQESFTLVFENGSIALFGSRLDDTKKGGDIDLYIKTQANDKVQKKITFLTTLKERIGEQKIDVVLHYDATKPIEQEAIAHGQILLEL